MELGRILASLSQFDVFVLKKLHKLHKGNDTDETEHGSLSYNETKKKMLSNGLTEWHDVQVLQTKIVIEVPMYGDMRPLD